MFIDCEKCGQEYDENLEDCEDVALQIAGWVWHICEKCQDSFWEWIGKKKEDHILDQSEDTGRPT